MKTYADFLIILLLASISLNMIPGENKLISPGLKTTTNTYEITTIAGSGKTGAGNSGYKDADGRNALFERPEDLLISADGTIYIMDNGNYRIRILKPEGKVISYAGSGQGQQDGTLTEGQFYGPANMCFDRNGDILVADRNYGAIRRVNKNGISTIAGGNEIGFMDGEIQQSQFDRPVAIAVNSKGEIFVCDEGNHRIRKISGSKVSTYAGNGNGGYADGSLTEADFLYPKGLVIDAHDNLYVMENNRIRKISAEGVVTTYAGKENNQGYKDGKGAAASFNDLKDITIDSKGTIYVVDDGGTALGIGRVSGGPAIRKISPDATVETIAGWHQYKGNYDPGTVPELIDGPVSQAYLPYGSIRGICADSAGNVFISDRLYACIRKMSKK